jgi:hypothetical protein
LNGIDHKNCDNCDTPICNECGDKYKERNPSHKVKIIKKKVVIPKKLDEHKQMDKLKVNCINYNRDIPVKNNDSIKLSSSAKYFKLF